MEDPQLAALVALLHGEAARGISVHARTQRVRVDPGLCSRRLAALENQLAKICAEFTPHLASPDLFVPVPQGLEMFAEWGLINRLSWVLGVSCIGERHPSQREASRAYLLLAEIWAIQALRNLANPASDWDESAAQRTFLHWSLSQEVRYMWVTRKICTNLAHHVETSPQAAESIRELTVKSVESLLGSIAEYVTENVLALDPDARRLARATSINAGAHSGTSFQRLLQHRDIEYFPWVAMPNGELLPLGLREASLGFDLALVDLIDRRTLAARSAEARKGVIFERAAQDCLAWALGVPPTFDRGTACCRINPKDEGELDVALGDPVELIGECKAKSRTLGAAAAASFTEQVGEAIKQVEARLAAMGRGTPIKNRVNNTETCAADNPQGLAVVMHSYSGSLTSPHMLEALPEPADPSAPVPVADLHSWVMILRAMRGPSEIEMYLRFRRKLLDKKVPVMDEFDLLVAYLNPSRAALVTNMSVTFHRAAHILNGCHVRPSDSFDTAEPGAADVWRRQLYRQATTNV